MRVEQQTSAMAVVLSVQQHAHLAGIEGELAVKGNTNKATISFVLERAWEQLKRAEKLKREESIVGTLS